MHLPLPDPTLPALPPVDWNQPWLASVRGAGLELVAALGQGSNALGAASAEAYAGASIADALNASPLASSLSHPVCFVSQHSLPLGESYEAFIRRTGQVPTRDNLHDLFNGLVWLHLPLSKAKLNELQSAEIARQGVGAVRGPVRDAITVFDENGAVLLAPEPLWQALLARDWAALFITHRALWAQARLVLFGHALMEQLVSPRKPLTAHVFIEKFAPDMLIMQPLEAAGNVAHGVPRSDPVRALTGCGVHEERGQGGSAVAEGQRLGLNLAALDTALAHSLCAERLAGKPFTPLPVLGVPGWWPDNESPAFYADTGVFRPARQRVVATPAGAVPAPLPALLPSVP